MMKSSTWTRGVVVMMLASFLLMPAVVVGQSASLTIVFSDNKTEATGVDFNFTYVADANGDTLELTFASHFGGVLVASGPENPDLGAGTCNVTPDRCTFTATITDGSTYKFNITGATNPRGADSYAINATVKTGGAGGTIEETVIKSVTINPHGIDDVTIAPEAGRDGVGKVADYTISFSPNKTLLSGDNITVKFPAGYNLGSTTEISFAGSSETPFVNTSTESVSVDVDGGGMLTSETGTFTLTNVSQPEKADLINNVTTAPFIITIRDDGDVVAQSINKRVTLQPADLDFSGFLSVTEGSSDEDTYTVELVTKPDANVLISIDPGDHLEANLTELIFTPSNWNVAQSVNVTAFDDNIVEGTKSHNITHTADSTDDHYDGLVATYSAIVADNDDGIVLSVTEIDVLEGDDDGAEYTVKLATQPSKAVTVSLEVPDGLTASPTELAFTTGSWNTVKTVTLTVDDNDEFDDYDDVTITHTAGSDDNDYDEKTATLTVTILDDEVPADNLSPSDIKAANKRIKLKVTETADGNQVTWTLPSGLTVQPVGVQVWSTASPYVHAATFDADDIGYTDAKYLHTTDDGATSDTCYQVTMFYENDIGKFTGSDAPDTNDYDGHCVKGGLPWWGWLLIGLGAMVLIGGIAVALLFARQDSGSS